MIEIYYAEDDPAIAESVKEYLEQYNTKVVIFNSIADAKRALINHLPSLVLLDWNMPDGQGNDLCIWIRERWSVLPVIYLTVRGDVNDIVNGFQTGADDYVVKPFDLSVLHLRIQALLRRSENKENKIIYCDDISLDKQKMVVFCSDNEIILSQPEYEILKMLLENKGKTITRRQLLEQIWDNNGNYVNDNTLTVTIKRLREKLDNPTCLKTIRSFGYRMEDTK
ncbi:MAG: response regulator transcription factor [Lachnospiraceae bacterium]|nr:response regulator transcription factor [Lachnospiraceae bacterium]